MNVSETREYIEISPSAVVSVYNKQFDGYVHVYSDGHVELTSPAGIVSARFRELEKEEWLRESYIRLLIESGIEQSVLRETLAAIQRVDRRLQEGNGDAKRAALHERSQQTFRQWCAQHDIAPDDLTEEQMTEIVSQGIEAIRRESGAARNQ